MSAKSLIQERYYQIIQSPYVSEKATYLGEKNSQVTFRVLAGASKQEIKSAVEFLFNVKVDSVHVLNAKGKVKRLGGKLGTRSCVRKAYVSLSEGQEINFAEWVN